MATEIEYMPIGKYKGKRIDELPSSYLKWVAETWCEDKPFFANIMQSCDREYFHREETNTHIEED